MQGSLVGLTIRISPTSGRESAHQKGVDIKREEEEEENNN
jgi:hypothetical protein